MAQVSVEAFPAEINVLLREGHFKARVTRNDKTHAPVSGLDIDFRTDKSKIEIGHAATNADGVAEILKGSLTDISRIVDELTSGYDAVFKGNDEFEPAQGHGAVILL